MAITEKHLYGWKKEVELQGRLEDLFGEPITKTTARYNKHDWVSTDYLIDLKCRMPPVTENSYPDWDAPVCKFFVPEDGKQVVCFYYFEASGNLFYIIYDPELFATYKQFKNKNGQATYRIPRGDWTQV
jgi:hypothetical protein